MWLSLLTYNFLAGPFSASFKHLIKHQAIHFKHFSVGLDLSWTLILRDRRKCTNGHILLHSHSCLHRLLSQSVVNHSVGASCVWSSTPPQIIIYGPAPGTWCNTPEMVCILLLFSPSSCCFDHQTPVGVVSSEQLLVHPPQSLSFGGGVWNLELYPVVVSVCLDGYFTSGNGCWWSGLGNLEQYPVVTSSCLTVTTCLLPLWLDHWITFNSLQYHHLSLSVLMMLRQWSTQKANDRYKDHLDGSVIN